MPSYIASATKAALRQAISERLGDWWPITSSGAGNGGATSAVFASLIGLPSSSIDNLYLLQVGATNTGEHRRISSFDPATGTITVVRAFTAQTASAEASELHMISPTLYTLAGNEAVAKSWPAVYRPIYGHYLANSSEAEVGYANNSIAVPRNLRDQLRVRMGGYARFKDLFRRANSTTTPGNSLVSTAGTWGITSELLYSATDADADFVTFDADLKDGYIRSALTGTLNHATVVRIPEIAFRIREDNGGAIDTTTCLIVRLQNGSVDLRKNDGGTEASLTTATQTTTNGTYYVVEVQFEGSLIRVWVDDVLLISYNLTGSDLKYMEYPQMGIRLTKGGSPTTAARVRELYAFTLHPLIDVTDLSQSGDRLTLQLATPGMDRLYHIEGRALLTAGASDTTFETIASPTTAVYEITTTDPAWTYLADEGAALMMKHVTQPANVFHKEQRDAFREATPMLVAEAAASRSKYAMPRPRGGFRHPS